MYHKIQSYKGHHIYIFSEQAVFKKVMRKMLDEDFPGVTYWKNITLWKDKIIYRNWHGDYVYVYVYDSTKIDKTFYKDFNEKNLAKIININRVKRICELLDSIDKNVEIKVNFEAKE